jgi:hypothetical protein
MSTDIEHIRHDPFDVGVIITPLHRQVHRPRSARLIASWQLTVAGHPAAKIVGLNGCGKAWFNSSARCGSIGPISRITETSTWVQQSPFNASRLPVST